MPTMTRPVKAKQKNSRMCFVCGLTNPAGLHASMYEVESGEVVALFRPGERHQGYPGRLHGGIAGTILDETIGRAIMVRTGGEVWGVTVEFTARYRKPVPLDVELRAVGRIVKDSPRFFEGTGEILLPDGTVAVEGRGRYIRMPLERISDSYAEREDWRVVESPDDPATLAIEGPDPRSADAGSGVPGSV
jgi:acyl-coenzyme A thioesterase PaaI-like protein